MNVFDFEASLNQENTITVPANVVQQLKPGQVVRVILLAQESEEDQAWKQLAAEEFLKGYEARDSIYDQLPSG